MKTTALWIALLVVVLIAAPLTGHADDDERGKLIDVTFEDTPVRTAITQVAEQAGANVIVSPKVKGGITLKLHSVPWRQALDAIAQAAGSVVIDEDYGIVRIVPANEAPRKARVQAELERAAELKRAAEVARMQVRLAEIEALRARAVAEGRTEEARRLLAQLTELRANVATEKVAPDHRPAQIDKRSKLHIVTVHDVRDLQKSARATLDELIREIEGAGARVTRTNGQLIVNADSKRQSEIARALEGLRRQVAAKQDIVLDFGEPKVVREKITSTKAGRYRVKLGPDGRILEKQKIPDDADIPDGVDLVTVGRKQVLLSRVQTDAQLAAARKRIAELSQALTHLRAAGAEADAKRLHGTIAKARAALDAAVKAREEAERRRQRVVPYSSSAPLLGRKSASGVAGLQASIQALRTDVNGLRREVRQLTGLVRELLEQRER